MKISIVIFTEGAAFEADVGGEVKRVLQGLAAENHLGESVEGFKLTDINGNSCGSVIVAGKR